MSDLEDEECDFQDPINVNARVNNWKRTQSSYSSQRYVENDFDEEEVTICTLCQSPWTNNGTHATVSLNCGHVFGKSCIQKFIKESFSKVNYARCPVCDNPTSKKDPRRIWPNKVLPCDESDLRSLKKENEKADEILQRLVEQKMKINLEIQQIKEELNKYEEQEMLMKMIEKNDTLKEVDKLKPIVKRKYIYQDTFSIPNEKYRVLELLPEYDMVALSVSKPSAKSFGIRKVNLLDQSLTEFIPNHSAQIKDIKNASNNMILSTGFDKTLKLTSLLTNQVVQSYQLDAPGWSCVIDPLQPNLIYCGVTNNTLLVFDIRNTKGSVKKLTEPCTPRDMSPIHSLKVFENKILCSNLARTYSWTESDGVYDYNPIDQFVECSYDKNDSYKNFAMAYNSQVLFTSLRNKSSTRYQVGHFESNKLVVDWSYDVRDQKQLSMLRNTVFKRDDDVTICISNANMVEIRNKSDLVQSIEVDKPVLDIKHAQQHDLLVILSEEAFQTYKFA